ncbi:hypothetical protein R6Q57_020256, partial [Mikania cordata]
MAIFTHVKRNELVWYHGTIDNHKLLLLDGPAFRKLTFTDTNPASSNPDPTSDVQVLASLDGLVLVSSLDTKARPNELVLWNPLTGAYRKLLSSSNDPGHDDMFYYSPAFAVFGFRKDDSCNDYKIAYLDLTPYYILPKRHGWFICFDVKTETFRKIRFPTVPNKYCYASLVVLNGHLHLCVTYDFICDFKHRDIWRMDGDGWVK